MLLSDEIVESLRAPLASEDEVTQGAFVLIHRAEAATPSPPLQGFAHFAEELVEIGAFDVEGRRDVDDVAEWPQVDSAPQGRSYTRSDGGQVAVVAARFEVDRPIMPSARAELTFGSWPIAAKVSAIRRVFGLRALQDLLLAIDAQHLARDRCAQRVSAIGVTVKKRAVAVPDDPRKTRSLARVAAMGNMPRKIPSPGKADPATPPLPGRPTSVQCDRSR